ncbi:hypothetical protein PXK30_22870, partial [Phaeobacter gallaeciensis]|uniref:calcium-binding protein n=1 Tax=Phaeobacter gallaeciensis TaxID=60890 RepID=UPI002977F06C|nr:hypothetical protein [Phaeobacter gallaeciensis]MDE4310929.1 hypothetical protein [Phaeobacter gallaeciensis]MDE4315392.1 hypothetical protein [Phaeobacter gallaeciensis]MDE4319856.1 hypothetical protein [Phaeobacter gallaeciensis]MDE4324319.1 hypothetical protein [Phaeobacter gallaeciensis]
GIWAQRYDANGVETGAIYQINTVETDAQTQPEATVLSDGRILVIWMSGNSNGTGEVRGRILDANGNPVAGNDDDLITPADTTANYAKTPEITALADGGFVAVWYEYHSSSSKRSVYLQQFDSAGNAITHYDQAGDPISGPIRVPSPISNNQTVPDVLALDTGGYVVTWTATKGVSGTDSYGGIFGQMFDSVGTPVGDDFHVNTTTADDQEHSRLVTLQDGGFMVLWKHDGSPDQLRFQKYYSDGTPSGGEGTLATGATMTDMGAEWQAISLLGGGVAVAWHRSDGDLYVQSFDEAGNSLTEVTTIETSLSTSNGANFTSDLDQLASGQLVVTWEYKGEVYSQTLSVPPDVAETVLTQGNDIFVGSTSGETILGLAGDDTIDGSGGDDRIEGGAGNDSLTGGNGADTFVFDAATGSDTVSDFTDESDLIEIETTGMPDGTGFANLVLTDMGSDLYVSFADPSITTVIKINNLSSAEFLDDDVIFV